MKDNLKKGQAFIGVDGNKYYYLGLDFNNQVLFTTPELWTNIEPEYYAKSKIFIKEVLDEKSELIENCAWYYESIDELDESSMKDKIKRCLDIINDSNLKDFKLKPTHIGPYVKGQAYSKEFNQFYEVIGFIVDNNIYIDDVKDTKETGFFAIYHSSCDNSAPLIFERSIYDENKTKYVAGNGDMMDVFEIIFDEEKVNSEIDHILKDRLEHDDERSR